MGGGRGQGPSQLFKAVIVTVFLLGLVQMMVSLPPKQTINSADSGIDERVDFSVTPLMGFTDEEGRLKVTFNCQSYVDGESSPYADWFLLKGKMMIESHEDLILSEGYEADGDSCGDEWKLEPGEYTINTRKTDSIRYQQSVEVHIVQPISHPLRIFSVVAGLVVTLMNSEDDKGKHSE